MWRSPVRTPQLPIWGSHEIPGGLLVSARLRAHGSLFAVHCQSRQHRQEIRPSQATRGWLTRRQCEGAVATSWQLAPRKARRGLLHRGSHGALSCFVRHVVVYSCRFVAKSDRRIKHHSGLYSSLQVSRRTRSPREHYSFDGPHKSKPGATAGHPKNALLGSSTVLHQLDAVRPL